MVNGISLLFNLITLNKRLINRTLSEFSDYFLCFIIYKGFEVQWYENVR